jgi:hypothetical protein
MANSGETPELSWPGALLGIATTSALITAVTLYELL